jgi:ankyrin repeat protein/catechol 2,3-dioxygenase-like lactoylglutathione lyase family enzyme
MKITDAEREAFFTACREGDEALLRSRLEARPSLIGERDSAGSTGLHLTVDHPVCLRLLLAHGADPDLRYQGDNATALHFAAARGRLESVRVLLDAGADVHGEGDVHAGDVIGWAVGDGTGVNRAVLQLLLERGARHHIFTAVALNDAGLVREVVAQDPTSLSRRRSRFEQFQTALHFALFAPDGISPKGSQYEIARLLLGLGADVNAPDGNGRAPLEIAMLKGDLTAMRLLVESGAAEPPADAADFGALGTATTEPVTPMLCVDDPDAAVAWYTGHGFVLEERYPERGEISWAALSFGRSSIMVQHRGARPHAQVALWFRTARIEELYQAFRSHQLAAARAALAGERDDPIEVRFLELLYHPFHGGRQFSIRDPNGLELVFHSS